MRDPDPGPVPGDGLFCRQLHFNEVQPVLDESGFTSGCGMGPDPYLASITRYFAAGQQKAIATMTNNAPIPGKPMSSTWVDSLPHNIKFLQELNGITE